MKGATHKEVLKEQRIEKAKRLHKMKQKLARDKKIINK